MLHDPAYRQRYEIDLRREFPRVYFQPDFHWWAAKGRELLDLHLGFETAEPWPLERVESNAGVGATGRSPLPGKTILRADKDRNRIILDDQTTLTGIPKEAWWYELGSRSALEWVLDQYKERKPRDPHHPRALQRLPLRRPQGAGHRPAGAGMHGQRANRSHRQRPGHPHRNRHHRVGATHGSPLQIAMAACY